APCRRRTRVTCFNPRNSLYNSELTRKKAPSVIRRMNPLMFADPAFLFCFAPVVLTAHYALPRSWRNAFLLAASLLLYAWGDGRNVTVLLLSMAMNYGFGLLIGGAETSR